jgi:4a-hydroxytetrahydrobiopterin dehydratase
MNNFLVEENLVKAPHSCLINKSCTPCKGGVPPLNTVEVKKLLKELGNEWTFNEAGHLYKEYLFNNFMDPMAFVNKVA